MSNKGFTIDLGSQVQGSRPCRKIIYGIDQNPALLGHLQVQPMSFKDVSDHMLESHDLYICGVVVWLGKRFSDSMPSCAGVQGQSCLKAAC